MFSSFNASVCPLDRSNSATFAFNSALKLSNSADNCFICSPLDVIIDFVSANVCLDSVNFFCNTTISFCFSKISAFNSPNLVFNSAFSVCNCCIKLFSLAFSKPLSPFSALSRSNCWFKLSFSLFNCSIRSFRPKPFNLPISA